MGKPDAAGTLESLMRPARGRRVLLDRDAAKYFQVRLSTLSATVERRYGIKRPRRLVRAFTKVGIESLASSLRSERAVAHCIATIRGFFAGLDYLRSRRI